MSTSERGSPAMRTTGLEPCSAWTVLSGMAAEPSMARPSTRVASLRTAAGRSSLPSASMSTTLCPRLSAARDSKAHQEGGVVGTGQLRQHQPMGLVVAHGQAAGCGQRHVIGFLGRVEDALAGGLGGDRRGALQHAGDGGDGDAGTLGDGVDRRPVRVRCTGRHRSASLLIVESAYICHDHATGPRRNARGEGRKPARRGVLGPAEPAGRSALEERSARVASTTRPWTRPPSRAARTGRRLRRPGDQGDDLRDRRGRPDPA